MTDSSFVLAQQRVAARHRARQAQLAAADKARHRLLPFSLEAASSREGTRPAFRVSQVDAELLDDELVELLRAQVGDALRYFGDGHLQNDWSAEVSLVLRALLFKLTVWDHDATYGAALQNLRYTDARRDGPVLVAPSRLQKSLYGLVTVVGRYAWTKWEDWLLDEDEPRSFLSRWTWRLSTAHSAAALLSFLVFLLHGRYRTLLDRVLRMRLAPPTSQVSREVSFEYLNRQLVWHAFTEFLLFVLPLVGINRWRRWLSRTWRRTKDMIRTDDDGDDASRGELAFLPERTCAICYQDQNEDPTTAMMMAAPSGVVGSAQTDVTNPYETIPCSCVYCFVCLATRLEREEGEGWTCLRCGEHVKECRPWSGDVLVRKPSLATKTVAFSNEGNSHNMSFFQFTQGTESRTRPSDSSPLLGRYRAVPPPRGSDRLLAGEGRGSVHVGYGALIAAALDGDDDEDDEDDGRRNGRWFRDLWVAPRQSAVKRAVDRWWRLYGLVVVLPAVLVVGWCAIPLPQYPLHGTEPEPPDKSPGHGAARVRLNFWFFLFVYYGFYSLTALVWITKVFNLYSLNWWPRSLGFPLTLSLIGALSLAVPIPVYFGRETRFLTEHNTAWIAWTFVVMALPVAMALAILMSNERHVGVRRHSLSETQRIFTSSWWSSEPDQRRRRDDGAAVAALTAAVASAPSVTAVTASAAVRGGGGRSGRRGVGWQPASFVRFLWLCVALFIGLLAYVLGEAYAEIYLRTLPHNSLETVVYVYGWVATVHLLDALTGWTLGIREGERVGSYPLSWVFKLYFTLTYQTYVRALYARLRSPSQFMVLQLLSSTSLVVLTPLSMTRLCHRLLVVTGLNGQSYGSYQKVQARNVFIRFLAENGSMATFLGSVAVLHYGSNRHVYPYFALDDAEGPYDLELTLWASSVTWACELVASLAVRALIRICFRVDVAMEGRQDLVVWPELLPTCVTVALHVLQNMMFSIIRLQF
ncbi:hypothetical protein CP532_4381 [Ophiocordyceps camponoti-leonardi (nom. inval.)]|nr:hypothetical protein CP532_4381 [Ophiocordyceps camponoti-leonardi (nom. inval.)]